MGTCCNTKRNIQNNELKISRDEFKLDNSENINSNINIDINIAKCICKINKNNSYKGTGFFCNIPFPDKNNLLPVLITNSQVLGKDDINEGKQINISTNNDNISYQIIIDESRKKYINSRSFEITIIELRKDDGLDIESFLEIDENIYEDNLNQIYKDKEIYLLHYTLNGNVQYSIGLIKNIDEDNINIMHSCPYQTGFLGSPLLNLSNNKVIGVLKENNDNIELNKGTFIKLPLEKFFDKNY